MPGGVVQRAELVALYGEPVKDLCSIWVHIQNGHPVSPFIYFFLSLRITPNDIISNVPEILVILLPSELKMLYQGWCFFELPLSAYH